MTRNEKKKMLAGELYNCLDAALIAEREAARTRLRRYNQASDPAERAALLHELVGQVGRGAMIESPFHCSYGQHIILGDQVYLNAGCTILDNNTVHIGDQTMLGPAVQIYTAAHPLEAEPRIQGWERARAIVIEAQVWIGGGAILLPGVRVGRGAVVGAGAVVTRNVPPYTVVAGNPARVIRHLPKQSAIPQATTEYLMSDNIQDDTLPPDSLTPNRALNVLRRVVGREFVELFTHGTLAVEYYRPDGVDRQQPHSRDEIYVIIAGSGTFLQGMQRHPFAPGQVLFVPAGVEHRFEDFTDDFATWVFFYGPEGGETP